MTTIGQRLIEQIGREVDRCDADAALKLAQTLACLPDRWALSEIPDAPKGPEPKPETKHLYYTQQRYREEALSKAEAAEQPVTKPAADLCAADLGRIIETNGYRGRLRRIVVIEGVPGLSVSAPCPGRKGHRIELNRGFSQVGEVTEEGGYVRLLLSEQHDSDARFPVLVKLDMPVRVMPEVTP